MPGLTAYQQYEATVDHNANAKNKTPDMMLKTYFGELQRIININVPATPELNVKEPQALFFTIVKQCKATWKEGFWEYTTLGGLEAVDIGLVQCSWPDLRPGEVGHYRPQWRPCACRHRGW